MEENKKRPLSEEELEQVSGGIVEMELNGYKKWRCKKCLKLFTVKEEAEEHEANCTGYTEDKESEALLKPIIL